MRADDPEAMERMRAWLGEVAAELGVEPEVVLANEAALLRMVAAVAHRQSRPGAPLTAFLVGVLVGRGADPAGTIEAARVLALDADPPR